jgi:hypothetical protein
MGQPGLRRGAKAALRKVDLPGRHRRGQARQEGLGCERRPVSCQQRNRRHGAGFHLRGVGGGDQVDADADAKNRVWGAKPLAFQQDARHLAAVAARRRSAISAQSFAAGRSAATRASRKASAAAKDRSATVAGGSVGFRTRCRGSCPRGWTRAGPAAAPGVCTPARIQVGPVRLAARRNPSALVLSMSGRTIRPARQGPLADKRFGGECREARARRG